MPQVILLIFEQLDSSPLALFMHDGMMVDLGIKSIQNEMWHFPLSCTYSWKHSCEPSAIAVFSSNLEVEGNSIMRQMEAPPPPPPSSPCVYRPSHPYRRYQVAAGTAASKCFPAARLP